MRRRIVTWGPSGQQRTRLFVNEIGSTATNIDYTKYDVFISHKGSDIDKAEKVGEILYECGVMGYLDTRDPEVEGDGPELEGHLRRVIGLTKHTLAVVSQATLTSWWVPFELGVARETNSSLATRLVVPEYRIELPSYLRTWPILVSDDELKQWALDKSNYITKSKLTELRDIAAEPKRFTGIDDLVKEGRVNFVS